MVAVISLRISRIPGLPFQDQTCAFKYDSAGVNTSSCIEPDFVSYQNMD